MFEHTHTFNPVVHVYHKAKEIMEKKNLEIVYVYKSKDQREIARITLSPSDYK